MPTTGIAQDPCDASTRSVPTKGAVHVTDVSVNVAPMTSAPNELPRGARRAERSTALTRRQGLPSASQPNRFAAKSKKRAASVMFTQGSAANRFRPAAPNTAANTSPRTVNVPTIPSPKSKALPKPDDPRSSGLEKYAIVTGTIGKTQGVSSERSPVLAASHRNPDVISVR